MCEVQRADPPGCAGRGDDDANDRVSGDAREREKEQKKGFFSR